MRRASEGVTLSRPAFLAAGGTFLLIGALGAVWGPVLGQLTRRFGISLPAAGTVFSAGFGGALFPPAVGVVIARFGAPAPRSSSPSSLRAASPRSRPPRDASSSRHDAAAAAVCFRSDAVPGHRRVRLGERAQALGPNGKAGVVDGGDGGDAAGAAQEGSVERRDVLQAHGRAS